MKDGYGRTIDYLRISITDRCNLRCRYCMPHGIALVPMEDILSYEEIERVCRAAADAGIRKLKITGGEPLVRFGCAELIGKLKKIPGIAQVTLTTNGVLLERYLPQLLENGLDAVNVSLDTLKPQVFREITGKDGLDSVRSGIAKAAGTGLKVKLNSVLVKGRNDGEWLRLIEEAERLGVDIRFIEMMPIGYGKNYAPVYNEQLLEELKKRDPKLAADARVHGNGPAIYYRLTGARNSIGFISAMHGKFCESCNRLRLTSQGKLKPCLCYEDSVDLMEILRTDEMMQDMEQKLLEAFLCACEKKPRQHRFEAADQITEEKQMVQIGG